MIGPAGVLCVMGAGLGIDSHAADRVPLHAGSENAAERQGVPHRVALVRMTAMRSGEVGFVHHAFQSVAAAPTQPAEPAGRSASCSIYLWGVWYQACTAKLETSSPRVSAVSRARCEASSG